jgi:hypothetical protein
MNLSLPDSFTLSCIFIVLINILSFNLKNFFYYFCKADLMTKCLSFWLSGDIFLTCNLVWKQFFSFTTLNTLSYSLLVAWCLPVDAWTFPHKWWGAYHLLLSKLFFKIFGILIILHLGVIFFGMILLGMLELHVSGYPRLSQYLAISLNNFSSFFSLLNCKLRLYKMIILIISYANHGSPVF